MSINERCNYIETTCDKCGSAILESEHRFIVTICETNEPVKDTETFIICEHCKDLFT